MNVYDIAGCALLHVGKDCYDIDSYRRATPGRFKADLEAALNKCRLLILSTNEYQEADGIEKTIQEFGGYVIENLEHSGNKPNTSRGINIWAIPGAHPIYLKQGNLKEKVTARGKGAIAGGKFPVKRRRKAAKKGKKK